MISGPVCGTSDCAGQEDTVFAVPSDARDARPAGRAAQASRWVVPILVAFAMLPALVVPGFVLRYDSVAVPDQDLQPWMWGGGSAPPRSVPQDAVIAALDNALPGWFLQRALMIGALLLLGFGVVRLLKQATAAAQIAAAAVAIWSVYVYERASIGHWGLLLGVATLPWLLDALHDVRAGSPGAVARAVGWGALGSLVPTAGATQAAATALALLWPGRRARGPCIAALGGILLLQLVWVVPGLANPGSTPPEASEVFALRSEGFAGPVLTALGTGGIWSSAAMPESRHGAASVVAPVLLVLVASLGVRNFRRLPGSVGGPLIVMSLVGLGWAISTALPSLRDDVQAIQALPGGGLLRDAHKWLGPWLIAVALLVGLGVQSATKGAAGEARRQIAVLLVMSPLLLLPDLALGMWGRLTPATYPASWTEVRESLAASSAQGDVVSWPWSAFRAYDWNDRRTVLDPASRFLPRTVVGDGRLLVDGKEGLVVVPSDDPRSKAVGESLLAPDAARRLGALGIGWILVQRDQPASPGFPTRLPDELHRRSVSVVSTPDLELRRLQGVAVAGPTGATLAERATWAIWVGVLGGIAIAGVRQSPRLVRRDRQSGRWGCRGQDL